MNKFDDYEIHPCKVFNRKDYREHVEQCEPQEAEFWTLYGHTEGEGLDAIGDFKTFEHAKEIHYKITGKDYQ